MNPKRWNIKLYPEDQIRRYLIIDIVVCVFMFYKTLKIGRASCRERV